MIVSLLIVYQLISYERRVTQVIKRNKFMHLLMNVFLLGSDRFSCNLRVFYSTKQLLIVFTLDGEFNMNSWSA